MNSITQTLDSIYDIDILIAESELSECESLLSMYDKMNVITENYTGDINDLDDFSIIQEGDRFDAWKKDVKKQNEGKSTINKILFTIPRMIISLFKLITGKLKKIDPVEVKNIDNAIANNEEYGNALTKFVNDVAHPKTSAGKIARNVFGAILAAGAATGAFFGGKKLVKVLNEKTNILPGKSNLDKLKTLLTINDKDSDEIKSIKKALGGEENILIKALDEYIIEINKKEDEDKKIDTYVDKVSQLSNIKFEKFIRKYSSDKKKYKEESKLVESIFAISIKYIDEKVWKKEKPDKLINNKKFCKILSALFNIKLNEGEELSVDKLKETIDKDITLDEKDYEAIKDRLEDIDRQKGFISTTYNELNKKIVSNNSAKKVETEDILKKVIDIKGKKLCTSYNTKKMIYKFHGLFALQLYVTSLDESNLQTYQNIMTKGFFKKRIDPKEFITTETKGDTTTIKFTQNGEQKLTKVLNDEFRAILEGENEEISIENIKDSITDPELKKQIDYSKPDKLKYKADQSIMNALKPYENYSKTFFEFVTAVSMYQVDIYSIARHFYYITEHRGKIVGLKTEANKKKLDAANEKEAKAIENAANKDAKQNEKSTNESFVDTIDDDSEFVSEQSTRWYSR